MGGEEICSFSFSLSFLSPIFFPFLLFISSFLLLTCSFPSTHHDTIIGRVWSLRVELSQWLDSWLRSQSTQIIIPVSGNLWESIHWIICLTHSKRFINLDLRIELHIKSSNYNEKIYEDAKQFKCICKYDRLHKMSFIKCRNLNISFTHDGQIWITLSLLIYIKTLKPTSLLLLLTESKQFSLTEIKLMYACMYMYIFQFICDPEVIGVCSQGRLENLCLYSRGTETLMWRSSDCTGDSVYVKGCCSSF